MVKLDTNGCYPDALSNILQLGLVDYVAMDIKNCPQKYAQTIGIQDFSIASIEKSIRLLLEHTVEFEFRTTIVRELHTADDLRAIGAWIEELGRDLPVKPIFSYYLQQFVDSGNLIGNNCHALKPLELQGLADVARSFFDAVFVRGV